MRPFIIMALIGLVVIAVAVMLLGGDPPPPEEQAEEVAAPASTRVLVAKQTISAGTFIRPDAHLGWEEWPNEKVAATPYLTEHDATLEDFSGAVVRRALLAGEAIPENSLVKSGEGGFMAAVLQPGFRAVSIAVTPTSGTAGFIFPGDRVDLILTHAIETLSGESYASETFVEDVRVLAVDQLLDNPENKAMLAKTITIEVTPRQAEAINVAREMGDISLSLRSLGNDTETAQTEQQPTTETNDDIGIQYFYPDGSPTESRGNFTRDRDISRVLGSGKSAPAKRVRVIHGDEQLEVEFQQPGR